MDIWIDLTFSWFPEGPPKVASFRLVEQTIVKKCFLTSVMSDAFDMKVSIKAWAGCFRSSVKIDDATVWEGMLFSVTPGDRSGQLCNDTPMWHLNPPTVRTVPSPNTVVCGWESACSVFLPDKKQEYADISLPTVSFTRRVTETGLRTSAWNSVNSPANPRLLGYTQTDQPWITTCLDTLHTNSLRGLLRWWRQRNTGPCQGFWFLLW